ncbi:hypothetical protein MPSEU_001045200 [Mayamaea pseudoterrestris]|nr:hypothetical protein MPSEU_001045200 [Mayamaea pseudoterrestris]
METKLDAAVKSSTKEIFNYHSEQPKTPVASSPLSASLHFVRTTSIETPTARGFLRSLSDDLPVFKSPSKKRTARKSLKEILGEEPYSPCSGDDSSACSAPAHFQRYSPKSTLLLSTTSHTFRSSVAERLRSKLIDQEGAIVAKKDHTLSDINPQKQQHHQNQSTIMTSSDESKQAAPSSLKERIAMFQQGAEKKQAVIKDSSRFKMQPSRRNSKDALDDSEPTAQATPDKTASETKVPTLRRTSGEGAGVADAVKKLQARNNSSSTQPNDQLHDSDESQDESAPKKRLSQSYLNSTDHSARNGSVPFGAMYTKPSVAPSFIANDAGAETDDASVVIETDEQRLQRKARRLADRETPDLKDTNAPGGGSLSSDDESIAPDRQRRAGKRKVKLRARDLGLTEAELKSLSPQELQENIKKWKKEHPKAGDEEDTTEDGKTNSNGTERGRGREIDNKVQPRSRSRADVKRRAKSVTRRPSCKSTTADEEIETSQQNSTRGRSQTINESDGATQISESPRRRTASRRRSSRAGLMDDEDRSVGSTLTSSAPRRRERSTTRRKSGAASVVSSAESTLSKTRNTARSKSVGRTRSSDGPSALGAALDKVSSHGDSKKKMDSGRDDTEPSRRRSKSVSHFSDKSRGLKEPSSPSSSRDDRRLSADRDLQASRHRERSRRASPDKSPAGSHRRSRSSAPSSRRSSSSNDAPQFKPAALATFDADALQLDNVISSKSESPVGRHERNRKEGKKEIDTFHVKPQRDAPLPASPDQSDSPGRKITRTISDMSPTKLGIHAFKKIRGVFGTKSGENFMDQLESPLSSPVKTSGRQPVRSKSGDSIFDAIFTDEGAKTFQDIPQRGVLRQPSGGIDAFDDELDNRRKGSRRGTAKDAPQTSAEVKTILKTGISEEQLQMLEAAGYSIAKRG